MIGLTARISQKQLLNYQITELPNIAVSVLYGQPRDRGQDVFVTTDRWNGKILVAGCQGARGVVRDQLRGGRLAQRFLDREEVTPGEALLQRAAQQEGRVKRRHGADFALSGIEGEPAPARLGDAFLDAEQRLR